MIVAAAVKDAKGKIHSAPAPARHWELHVALGQEWLEGFVTDTGEFLSRAEAAKIALASGQVAKAGDYLMCADLWP